MATLFVALAMIGLRAIQTSAGKEMSVPPPTPIDHPRAKARHEDDYLLPDAHKGRVD